MDIRTTVKSQYHAALRTLREAIERCPDDLWTAGERHSYWHIAYHTLFYTHLYLQQNVEAFHPWEHHRDEYECLGQLPEPPHRMHRIGSAYTRREVLDYWAICDGMVDSALDAMDLDRAECGFFWYDVSKLEHQMISIRHIQHHAGQLIDRLRASTGRGVDWIAKG